MRAQARQTAHEEEEESAFVSMTDMTVGFLFIIMILLAFFASQVRQDLPPETVEKSRYEAMEKDRDRWRSLAEERALMISNLEEQLEELKVEILAKDAQIEEFKVNIEALQVEIERLRRELESRPMADQLEIYLARVSQTRREILERLRDAIKVDFPDLQVELSEESDALRFQGEGLFATNQATLTRQKQEIVSRLSTRLDEVLPCFTIGPNSTFDAFCNPSFVMIEAIQIEGHTDDVGSDATNRNLSAARANQTFFTMTGAAPTVMAHRNLKSQPVLSVAAYGPDRPVTSNETPEGRATNRRIDLRFIMVTPQDTNGIERIKDALSGIEGAVE